MGIPDNETNYLFFETRQAWVLAGGGARAAYQVGVLRAIADFVNGYAFQELGLGGNLKGSGNFLLLFGSE